MTYFFQNHLKTVGVSFQGIKAQPQNDIAKQVQKLHIPTVMRVKMGITMRVGIMSIANTALRPGRIQAL